MRMPPPATRWERSLAKKACDNGPRASIADRDKQYLWATSGGHCANPACRVNLFASIGDARVPFGELAHIIAATPGGPRDRKLGLKARAAATNVVMLCANCHTVVDKAPETFSVDLLRAWQLRLLREVESALGAVSYDDRAAALVATSGLLLQNATVFNTYGPASQKAQGRHGEEAVRLWRRKMQEIIIPNNRRLLAILDKNQHLQRDDERQATEMFRQHVDDVEARHFHTVVEVHAVQFPEAVQDIFKP